MKLNLAIITALSSAFIHDAVSQPMNGAGHQGMMERLQHRSVRKCLMDAGNGECAEDYWENAQLESENEIEEEEGGEDPMLAKMPGLDFKAYRRADISSFYQEEPGSRTEKKPKFNGQAGKFVNMSPQRLDLYWDDGEGPPGMFNGNTGPFEASGTSTFPKHQFFFLKPKTLEVVCTFPITEGTSVYYCNPFEETDPNDPASGLLSSEIQALHSLTEEEREFYDALVFNREFAGLYKNFTGGSEWLGLYPTEPPTHHMWRADYFGQEHQIQTKETFFVQLPPAEDLHPMSYTKMKRNKTDPLPFSEYREPGLMNITIKAISCAPRIFQIDNFLSEVEVDHLLDLAMHNNLARSTTGSGKDEAMSDTRTSKTTWIARHKSPIVDAILRRGADVLKIDEALMRHRTPDEYPDHPNRDPINEDFQLVHYDKSEQYTAHHDFGYPDTRPNAPSRSINLCIYLNEGMKGGETAFPRWRNADTSDAIKATPRKGKAMIFYMRTPDGNLDDLSQHAALPVIEGEKWFANLWTWDPARD